jgi:hypothetical protein
MLKFNEYLNEKSKYTKEYSVDDLVYINYWLTGDMTPVKIIEKKGNNYFIVSHKVENSHFYNAPNQGIKKDEIIGMYQGIGEISGSLDRRLDNPNTKPDTSGIIPGWNSYNSNDIAF